MISPRAASGDLDRMYKGWPPGVEPAEVEPGRGPRLNLFDGGFLFPVAAISAPDLNHNLAVVSRFCVERGVSLAPHGKTTMSPEIIVRQLDAGAWAITAATASQARVMRAFGVERVLIAHQLVDPAAVRWAFDELAADPQAEILALVDSIEAVEAMERALSGRGEGRPIDVLVELGARRGRTGCRSIDEAVEVASRAAASDRLRLVGAEAYEGVLHRSDGSFETVDELLGGLRELVGRLDGRGMFDHLDEIVVTAGGSTYPDRVVALLGGQWAASKPVRLVIRPGCYVTHDSRHYEEFGPFGARPPMADCPRLRPALTVWSYVVSRPEPGLALLGFGKRDASYDVDLPVPAVVRRGEQIDRLDGELEVFRLDDQHAYAKVAAGFDLAVGDMVGCGISHPCTTFERWRAMPLVDEHFDILGAVRTFF